MKKGNDSGGRGVGLNFYGKYPSNRRRNKMNCEILFFPADLSGKSIPRVERRKGESGTGGSGFVLVSKNFPRSVFPEMESSGM